MPWWKYQILILCSGQEALDEEIQVNYVVLSVTVFVFNLGVLLTTTPGSHSVLSHIVSHVLSLSKVNHSPLTPVMPLHVNYRDRMTVFTPKQKGHDWPNSPSVSVGSHTLSPLPVYIKTEGGSNGALGRDDVTFSSHTHVLPLRMFWCWDSTGPVVWKSQSCDA